MERNCIGLITKPQALKGEFRVKPYLLNLKEYKKIKIVYIQNKEYNVEKVTLRDTFVIFKLEGIDTCEQAEVLRNIEIFADLELDFEDNLNLKNFIVKLNEEELGTIIDINNYGSKDIVSVKGARNFMFPIIDDLIVTIDENSKVIELSEELFEQVVVYED